MRLAKWICFGTISLILLIIVFQNLKTTEVHLLFAKVEMPEAALLGATLAIGFAMGLFANALWKMRAWRARSAKAKKARKAAAASNDTNQDA